MKNIISRYKRFVIGILFKFSFPHPSATGVINYYFKKSYKLFEKNKIKNIKGEKTRYMYT